MIRTISFATLTILVLPFLFVSPVLCNTSSAQQWAVDMFETTSHNFGTVARGAKADFEFVFNNIYLEDVHVASVSSSCGCTKVSIKQPATLKTYQKGAIVATINTAAFLGNKGSTITVTFDKPQYAQVQFHVRTYIRSDVVFEPGGVSFGTVDVGTPMEHTVNVHYAGHSGWAIEDVISDNPHITADVVETSRGGGRVSYRLTVHLDEDSPAGYINEHLMLVTNDQGSRQVPLQVEGRINAGVTVSPSTLFMGVVKPGHKVEKKLVVRGKKPFRILSIDCPGGDFQFDKEALGKRKKVHVVSVTFVAGDDAGKISRTIQIETDLGSSSSKLSAFAVVAE